MTDESRRTVCWTNEQVLGFSDAILVMHTHEGQESPDWKQFALTPSLRAEIEEWRISLHEATGES